MDFCKVRQAGPSVSAGLLMAALSLGCAATDRDTFDRASVSVDAVSAQEPTSRPVEALLDAPTLGRAAFVRAVLARNRSIEAARQAWRAARARVRESGAFEDPMVTTDIAPLSVGSSSARLGWDATVSQRLPWPGKLALDKTVATSEADAAKNDFEAARRDLALTAALLFDQYFVSARSIEINAHHVDLMRSMQAAAAAQYESGRGSAQDPLQAEFELAHMEHDTVILASQREVTLAQMNELLHRPPEALLPPPPTELPTPREPDILDPKHLQAEALARRPDIAAARQRARSAQGRIDRAHREYLPDVTVQTGYNAMWDTPEHRWTVGLSFNLPVQTGRRDGAVDEAEAMRAKYEAEAATMSDAVRTQVVVALKQLEESAHVLHLYEQRLVPIARDEVDAARSAFTASQTPFVAVIDAEKNLRGVELDQQMARADNDRRRVELDRALGRVPGLDGSGVTP